MIRSGQMIFEETNLELINWISISGVSLVVIAYFAVSTNRLSGDSVRYQLLNLIGALLILVEVFQVQAWGSVTINVLWALIALWTLRKIRKRHKERKL